MNRLVGRRFFSTQQSKLAEIIPRQLQFDNFEFEIFNSPTE
jgi:hypothetical protein